MKVSNFRNYTDKQPTTTTLDAIVSAIRGEVEADGAVYAPGSHNDYVMRVGYKLNQFGFSRDAAVEWARRAFPDYADTEQVILSCYNRTEEFATKSPKHSKRLSHSLQANSPNASVDDIKTFLGEP